MFDSFTQTILEEGTIVYAIEIRRFFCRRCVQSDLRSPDSVRLPPRPLRSTGITPLQHYYEPLRLPLATTREVIDSPEGLSAPPTSRRVSQVPGCSSRARYLLPPRRALPLLAIIPSRQIPASSISTDWPLSIRVTRLNRVRFRYGSRVRLPRLRRRNCSRASLGRLHVQRSIYMADSFHSARNSQALLGAPKIRGL